MLQNVIEVTKQTRAIGDDAQGLEALYATLGEQGQADAFAQAIHTLYAQAEENLLYAAWHYRLNTLLKTTVAVAPPEQSRVAWLVAIGLGLLNGLLFWLLSDFQQVTILDRVPLLPLIAAPLYATLMMGFVSLTTRRQWARWAVCVGLLVVAVLYVIGMAVWRGDRTMQGSVSMLQMIHLPALAWFAVGLYLLWDSPTPFARFAGVIKSVEAVITAGLFLAAGGVFTALTFGLFTTLTLEPPVWMIRLFAAGGLGLVPLLAVAAVYRPELPPALQIFAQGLSKLIALILRLLLPLTLLVAVVYIVLIPANFMQPFQHRESLIVYNAMLFAIIGLLVGATPVQANDLSPGLRMWLRRCLLALVCLTLIVAFYAMAAILYRTWQDGWTPNRLAVIGWNVINISILALLLYRQRRTTDWLSAIHATISTGLSWYALWSLLLVLLLPWLFGGI